MAERTAASERRSAIAVAVAALADRDGLEGVTLRRVATEAGISMGRVQHYFATRDDLVLHGLRHAQSRMEARIEQRLAGTDGSSTAVVAAVLEEMVGGHPEAVAAVRISTAYLPRARSDAAVASLLTDGDAEILAAIEAELRGPSDGDPHTHLRARALWALTQALAIEVSMLALAPEDARAVLDQHLRDVAPDLADAFASAAGDPRPKSVRATRRRR